MNDELRAYILHEGLDDWVPYEALRGVAPTVTDADRVAVIEGMAKEGLIEVGDLRDGPFRAWGGTVDDWTNSIRRLLLEDEQAGLGIWLKLVPR